MLRPRLPAALTPVLFACTVLVGCDSRTAGVEAADQAGAQTAQPAPGGAAEPETMDRSARKREALRGIDYSGSVARVDAAAARQPDDAAAALALEQVRENLEINRNWTAIEAATQAVLFADSSAVAWGELGRTLLTKGLPTEAHAAYQAALELAPDEPGLLMASADAMIRIGDRAAAIGELQRVLSVSPENAAARERLALQLYYTGQTQAAWTEVHAVEAAGGQVPPQFRVLLSKAMAEPR